MGNVIQYLKDPVQVRRFQEALGVRQICIEEEQKSPAGPSSVFDSAEDSPEELTKEDDPETVSANEKGEGSLSWISKKARIRRRVPANPLQHHSHQTTPSPKTNQVMVIETISFLDLYFRLATELGYEPFYITFVPFLYWNIDTMLSRYLVLTWAISMYLGQGAKQVFRIKRPTSPPVIRLETNPGLESEYGFPSTHATVGTMIPFCLLYNIIGRYQVKVYD